MEDNGDLAPRVLCRSEPKPENDGVDDRAGVEVAVDATDAAAGSLPLYLAISATPPAASKCFCKYKASSTKV